MLKPISHVLKNPNDFPDVPRAVKEYLQVRYNYSFLSSTGILRQMASQGYSQEFLAGFVAGLEKAANILDESEIRKEQLQET